jgi:hypothetical protein
MSNYIHALVKTHKKTIRTNRALCKSHEGGIYNTDYNNNRIAEGFKWEHILNHEVPDDQGGGWWWRNEYYCPR